MQLGHDIKGSLKSEDMLLLGHRAITTLVFVDARSSGPASR